ncbi:MAG: hypothetical protein Q9202_004468 [Teloschistes flavicans]
MSGPAPSSIPSYLHLRLCQHHSYTVCLILANDHPTAAISKYSMESYKPTARRGVAVLLLLLGAGLIFSFFTNGNLLQSTHSAESSHLRRQTPLENTTINASTANRIALPFGNNNNKYSPNVSHPKISPPSHKTKRDDDAAAYEYCLCKGRRLYTEIGLISFGLQQSQGTSFTFDQLENAWETVPQLARFEPTFDEWAQDTIGRSISDDRVNRTKMAQNKAYTSVGGDQMLATGGSYEILYIRSAAAIIAHSIISPRNILSRRTPPVPLPAALPPLNRFSDIAWYLWTDILRRDEDGPADSLFVNAHKDPRDPSRLQYVGHNLITNSLTAAVIAHVIEERNEGEGYMPWPGVTLDVAEEEEGKALLGTPNGVGTAWLYMDHYRQMGKRRLTVDIWSCSEEYPCMMWNLEDD